MAFTPEDLAALDQELLATGTLKAASFGDQRNEYRDTDDILKLRAVVAGAARATTGGSRSRFAVVSKGA